MLSCGYCIGVLACPFLPPQFMLVVLRCDAMDG